MRRIPLFVATLLLFCSQSVSAQLAASTKVIVAEQFLKKANAAYEKKDFSTALDYYLTVLNDNPKRETLYWKTAESAFNTRRFNIAKKFYEQIAKLDEAKTLPMLNWRRAIIKKMAGDYDGALALLNPYLNQSIAAKGGVDFTQDIQNEIASCEWAKSMGTETVKFEAKPLDDNVNTSLTDIAAVQYGNTLYYTTAYLALNKKPVTQIFSSDFKNKSQLANVNPSDSLFTAGYALNKEGSRVYFNICTQKEDGTFHCEIFTREKLLDDRWSTPVKLPETVNNSSYTASNPTVGRDETGKETLYFASDRPGGKGKLDIWSAELDAQGMAGTAKNFSEVNTSQDDITPYYFSEGNTLFFSSEGHKSFGGFDVFYIEKTPTGEWTSVKNSEQPINSTFDDTYFSVNGDKGFGYFSTNRKGKNCNDTDKDCICNDIYNYEIKTNLKVETLAGNVNESLIGCRIDLVDIETGLVVQTITNATANDFNFNLDLNKKYRIIASKPNHVTDSLDFDTKGIWQSKTLSKQLKLTAFPKLTVYVMDEIDRKPIDGAKLDIFETGTNNRVASEILTGSVFTWDKLEYGKSYRIVGTKDTYEGDTNTIFIAQYTPRGENKQNYVDTLYLLPFRGLPLTLYFDNDHPNPNTRDTITFLTYGETYMAYSAKEQEYLDFIYKNGDRKRFSKFKKGLKKGDLSKTTDYSNSDPISATQANAVSDFFNGKIRKNYEKLMSFSGLMGRYLSKKQTLEIVIEGYASPLADPDYNRILTSRRIMSIYNHFYQFDGGSLRSYMLNNQLRIRVLPLGEDKVEGKVSDDARDRRNSVFSVEAMKERKVEIKEINLLNDSIRGLSIELKQFLQNKDLLSFIDNRMEVESRLSKRKVPASYSKTGLMVGNEMAAKGGSVNIPMSGKPGTKQRIDLVLMDAFTGQVIEKNGSIEFIDQNDFTDETNANATRVKGKNTNASGKAKRKGLNYHYDVPLDKNVTIKSRVAGYNEVSKGSYTLNTEGGMLKSDTVMLTPFSGLPLSLYFDNDRPDPNSQKQKTTLSYDKSYKSYFAQKNTFVKKHNSILLKSGNVPSAINEMEEFFNVDVKNGFETLEGYAYIIKSYLAQGLNIEVVIEGYASPLANATYNEYLAQRRINSVINFFSSYGGGDFKNYFKNGQLKLQVRPLGERLSASSVSDDSRDPQSSIYGLDASRERRVVIKDIFIRK
jgi:outer membrane protein OmpA-like peptidoglycan-associated protein